MLVESCQQVFALLARRNAVERGRVERDEQRFSGNRRTQTFFQLLAAHVVGVQDVVDADGTRVEHTFRILAQLDDTTAVFFRFRQMNMAHFRNRMPYAFIVCALADGTAGDMGDGNAENQRSTCHGKHFVAVAENQQQVGAQLFEGFCHACHTFAHGGYRSGGRIRVDRHRHTAVNGQSVAFDFLIGVSVFFRQVHVGGHNLQAYILAAVQLAGNSAQQPPVGTRACHNTYFSLHRIFVIKGQYWTEEQKDKFFMPVNFKSVLLSFSKIAKGERRIKY